MPATIHQGEVDALLDTLPRESRRPRGANDPLMPFDTHLQLTHEQEQRLVQHVLARHKDLEAEAGRDEAALDDEARLTQGLATLHAQGVTTKTVPWMVRRALFYRHFYNNYEDRRQEGTIYAQSNVTASLSPRVTMQVAGRLKSALFGTDPWFSASPVGESDEELARKTREFVRFKADQSKFLQATETAVDLACIIGECVEKTTFVDDRLWYWRKSPILVKADGTPKFDTKGNYIFQEDRQVPEMIEQQPDPNLPPEMVPTGRTVLRRDNSVVIEETDRWEVRRVRVGDVKYKGAKTQEIRFTDFLCPLSASCVHEADIAIHLYDKPAMEVASWFLQGRFSYMASQEEISVRTDEAVKVLKDISASASLHSEGTDLMTVRSVHGEAQTPMAPGSSGVISVIEAWVRYDADEDGFQEEIVILVNPQTMLPLYYEYVGMATDDRRRPFTVQRVRPVYGRWYGQGVMEYLEPEQLFLDLLVNRINVATSRTGSVTFWDPSKTVEGLEDPNLVLNTGKTYRLHGDAQAEEVLKIVQVYSEGHIAHLRDLFELFMQLLQLKTGVISAADESVQGIESAKLATGIRSLEKSGNELFASWVKEASTGVHGTLEKFCAITLMHLDERETWDFTEGDNRVFLELSREDVHGLRVNVMLNLVNDEGERIIASGREVLAIMRELVSLPPETAAGLAPVAVEMVRALKVPYPEDRVILPPPPLPMMAGPGAPGAGGAAGAAPAALPDAF
jgi:hypothetical protein